MKKIIFSDEQLQEIIETYTNEHLSMSKIGKKFGVSKEVISRVLKENNITIVQDNHIYKANYRTFKVIDSPEKAYWLGFLAADGCVYTREQNATVRLAIQQKDKIHLENFRDFMKSNAPIKDFINDKGFSQENPSPISVINFNSKLMAQDLINLGIVERKSLILQPPKIDKQYYLPFIMGYFDGDGSIYKFNQKTEFGIEFIGSKEIIEWINKTIGLNATLEQRTFGSQTYHIRCGGTNKPYNILKPLYESCETHLARKFNLYKELETVVLNRNVK